MSLCIVMAVLFFNNVPAQAQPSLINSFNPGLGGLCSIAFDPVSGNVFIYHCGDANIHEFTPTETEVLPAIARPGNVSNDIDLDFAPEAMDIGGTMVPANTLLVINGDDSPQTLRGLNKDDGTVLDSVNLSTTSLVGGSYHAERNTFFAVNFENDLIQEMNSADGTELNSFPVAPGGSPAFDVFFGDVDVSQGNGSLVIVSSSQNVIRVLTPTGAFVRDIAVGSLGVSGMSGIAIDDGTGEVWISSTNGTVYQLGGLDLSLPLDHFLCYKAKTTAGTEKFLPVPGVILTDQFGTEIVEVKKPVSLCNPADKNGEGITDSETHLKGYQIKPETAHVPVTNIKVVNQFGELFVDTIKPDRLLVPSLKDLVNPVTLPDPFEPNVDHYQCYKVKVTPGTAKFPKGIQASVKDQFNEVAKLFDIKKPSRLCNPVDKNGGGILNPAAHLMCYKVKPATAHTPVSGIHTNNQFGPEQLDTIKEEELCVPSEKILP